MPVTVLVSKRVFLGRILIVAFIILAFVVYGLICKVWPAFESFGFPIVIAAVFAAIHGLYWYSNREKRIGWSVVKARVVYLLTLVLIEGIALGFYLGISQGQSTTN